MKMFEVRGQNRAAEGGGPEGCLGSVVLLNFRNVTQNFHPENRSVKESLRMAQRTDIKQ